MKVLYIAPLPPPISGHSLASEVFLKYLKEHHEVSVVNLSKSGFKQGIDSVSRIFEVFHILKKIWRGKKDADVIYFTISESLAGNIKDVLIYLICINKIKRTIIHLHGGSIRKLLFDKYKLIFLINKYFIKKLGGVIVLGESHISSFADLIGNEKIHLIPNFAEDYIFTDPHNIIGKFKSIKPLKIVFLSNLIYGKGYYELFEAFKALDNSIKPLVNIDFAGGFESNEESINFTEKIDDIEQIRYHGILKGQEKKSLLETSHVFCLPTKLNEGQPISILEAYAAGCVVITTHMGGIPDIFKNRINGFQIKVESHQSIKKVIEELLSNKEEDLLKIAMGNRNIAYEKYRISRYNKSLLAVIEGLYLN